MKMFIEVSAFLPIREHNENNMIIEQKNRVIPLFEQITVKQKKCDEEKL